MNDFHSFYHQHESTFPHTKQAVPQPHKFQSVVRTSRKLCSRVPARRPLNNAITTVSRQGHSQTALDFALHNTCYFRNGKLVTMVYAGRRCSNPGLFVPLRFRSRERKVHRENFRSRWTFVPWNIRSLELSFLWNFRSSGTNVPRTFVPMKLSFPENEYSKNFRSKSLKIWPSNWL